MAPAVPARPLAARRRRRRSASRLRQHRFIQRRRQRAGKAIARAGGVDRVHGHGGGVYVRACRARASLHPRRPLVTITVSTGKSSNRTPSALCNCAASTALTIRIFAKGSTAFNSLRIERRSGIDHFHPQPHGVFGHFGNMRGFVLDEQQIAHLGPGQRGLGLVQINVPVRAGMYDDAVLAVRFQQDHGVARCR